jgi:hypothetical protein
VVEQVRRVEAGDEEEEGEVDSGELESMTATVTDETTATVALTFHSNRSYIPVHR